MEVTRGLLAVGGGAFRLPRRIPYHIASEMILTGELKSAEEMKHYGLVNRICESGEEMEEALALARLITRNSPIAVQAAKEIASRSEAERWTDKDTWKNQADPYIRVQKSEDLIEGITAFSQKRDPVWKGK